MVKKLKEKIDQKLSEEEIAELHNIHYHYGEWAINKIKIKLISKHIAIIEFHKYESKIHTYSIVVKLNIIDRLKKTTLEDKIKKAKDELISELQRINAEIRVLKDIERRVNDEQDCD